LATNAEAGLRIASNPYRFWDARGYYPEMGGWLRQYLEQRNKMDGLRVQALLVFASSLFTQGIFPESIRIIEQALQITRTISNRRLEAYSLAWLGAAIILQGNLDEGIPLLEQSLAMFRDLGDRIGQADTIGWLSLNNAKLERAISYAGEGVELHRELGDLSGIAENLSTLSRLTIYRGDFFSPVKWLEEARLISRQLGSQSMEAYVDGIYGNLAYWQGNHQQSVAYYEQGILLYEKLGNQFQILWENVHMAYPVLRMGDIQKARHLFEKSIRDAQKADLTIALVFAVEGVASLFTNQNQPERAARLFAWADAMRNQLGDHRPPVEQNSVDKDLAVIHSKLDDAAFEQAYNTGHGMTTEQAIALALEE
jgi:tetratricopeptide (TPR) repeat protein